jgi:4-hydroxybenzoate polyprenyltransferase
MRLDRPIGIWLLMWPMLWALWIAAGGHPVWRVLAIMVAGVVVMRSAGCIVNDFADRNVDPYVRRTRDRPLAARRVSPYEALVLFALLIALALWLVTRLDPLTVRLSFVGAARARLRLGRADGIHGRDRCRAAGRLAGLLHRGAVGGDLRHRIRHGRSRG